MILTRYVNGRIGCDKFFERFYLYLSDVQIRLRSLCAAQSFLSEIFICSHCIFADNVI